MGRYTDRSRLWELSQTFVLFLVLGFCSIITYGAFTPLIVFIVAYRVSYLSWAIKSVIVMAIHSTVMGGIFFLTRSYSFEHLAFIMPFLMVGSAYVSTVFMSFFIREYLERLDLKNYMKLEADVSYSYRVVKDSLLKLQAKEKEEKDVFLDMLQGYRAKITDTYMINNLIEMAHLANLIVDKDKDRSRFFFLKHSSALDSILKQYIELQDLPILDFGVEQLRVKLHEVIGLSRVAFENELVAMFDVEIMSVASEADFYKNYVQAKGLL